MGELMDGQPLFPGDSEVDQLFVIQKVLGALPDFLQDEFNHNVRYQGLKFPEIHNPETIEARYSAVMNDIEIDLMQRMLDMNPYQRITARQAIEHDYFDDIRAKDPEYNGEKSQSSLDATMGGQESAGQLLGNSKRILSTELLNGRQRAPGGQQQQNNFNLTNKNSYSHTSHQVEATRRSDNNYQNIKQGQAPPPNAVKQPTNSSQQNMMMKSNNSGSNFIGQNTDPINSKKGNQVAQGYPPNVGSPLQNNFNGQPGSSHAQNRKNSKNSKQGQDYNYNINLEKATSVTGQQNNPLLASVQTQGSLKGGQEARKPAKGSGASQGSHGGSAINISKKDALQNMKSGQAVGDMGPTTSQSNNRVGSINSNPGSTYNIHSQQNQGQVHMQTSNSPPSVRNKIQMHKISKNSNSKNSNANKGKGPNQYTMYQSNHLPMTSQQSRRKSQVSINNMINQQIDPLQAMNFQGMNMAMGMGLHNQNGFVGGMSDTGAAPDNSSGGAMMQIGMYPHQNFTGSSLAQYQGMNAGSVGGMQMQNANVAQQFSSQDKKRSTKGVINKGNMRFNNQFDGTYQGAHMNMPMSSNAVLH